MGQNRNSEPGPVAEDGGNDRDDGWEEIPVEASPEELEAEVARMIGWPLPPLSPEAKAKAREVLAPLIPSPGAAPPPELNKLNLGELTRKVLQQMGHEVPPLPSSGSAGTDEEGSDKLLTEREVQQALAVLDSSKNKK